MTPETDAELVGMALAGDRLAAGRLLERYRRMALATAYSALGSADDAHDVAQEALVYALQRLPHLRDPGRFAGWLRQITLSLGADYRRRRGTRRLGVPLTALNEASEEDCIVERLAIRQAMAGLSEVHRTTLLLRYMGGWSVREVAELLGVPVNTVRSRLLAAKRSLRVDLRPFLKEAKPMSARPMALSPAHTSLLAAAFPGARVLSVEDEPEAWLPFRPRVWLALADGTAKAVDFRADIDLARAQLLPVLHRLGIPGPRLIHGPVEDGAGRYLSLCELPRGENLGHWALGGTPHRIRLATERASEAIDLLQAQTDALLADPVGAALPRRTLSDEVDRIAAGQPTARFPGDVALAGGLWLDDPWFASALARTREAAADIRGPLVYTDYLHFQAAWIRLKPGTDPFDTPWGWPGDERHRANPLAEIVSPFGHIGDPLLGLAMVWVYDGYPWVHTGFVEQFLWHRNATRRDFAPRLAIKALQTLQRELPVARPTEGGEYWDAVRGWVDQALSWM